MIYRHVYITHDRERFPQKHRPSEFNHDDCFRNLVETVGNHPSKGVVKIIIYYNGTREQFLSDPLCAYLDKIEVNVEVFLLSTKSAVEAVLVLLRETLSMDLNDQDIVYFLENDYIHHENWVNEVLSAYSSNIPFDYLSLYDHPDRYKIPKNYQNTELFTTGTRHWVTAPSTCGSFLVQFGKFKRDFKYVYSTKNDHQMFSRLTGKLKRKLITPVPGLAVHCMAEHLDPIQRFEEYFKRPKNE
ncbi:Glycosyl transferase family 2 [Roseateles saccharophilus]|uniref:Glycosyl transferase family 2 n=1 Tax=Roseateles saccharophilus TaxID=304 RepID=A0A4R3U7U4_ROSSA|nr:hypothetical protein EV671_10613 [Roseateles saccharophilus]